MKRYRVDPDLTNIYFSTSTIVEWQCVFKEEKYFQIIIDSLKFCQKQKGLYLLGYVIMLNHVHLLTGNNENTSISNIMRDFRHYTANQIIKNLSEDNEKLILYVFKKAGEKCAKKQQYKVWQDDFHPEAILSEDWLQQKMEYIHYNPVKKGYIEKPEYWKYSSARNWLCDDDSIIEIDRTYLF